MADPAAFGRLCVETVIAFGNASETAQLPSGGWVLKPELLGVLASGCIQPPLGGWMLKRSRVRAESRRWRQPPLGGCVLKHRLSRRTAHIWIQPPSGGWVLKHILEIPLRHLPASRLQAAIYSGLNLNQDKAKKPQTVQIVRQGEATPYWFKVNPLYQYNSEISYNKGRLKTLSIGFQTTFFSHQHKPDTLE